MDKEMKKTIFMVGLFKTLTDNPKWIAEAIKVINEALYKNSREQIKKINHIDLIINYINTRIKKDKRIGSFFDETFDDDMLKDLGIKK